MQYNASEIEKKWQKIWDENETYKAGTDMSKPKFYGLVEFPYPSDTDFTSATRADTPRLI